MSKKQMMMILVLGAVVLPSCITVEAPPCHCICGAEYRENPMIHDGLQNSGTIAYDEKTDRIRFVPEDFDADGGACKGVLMRWEENAFSIDSVREGSLCLPWDDADE